MKFILSAILFFFMKTKWRKKKYSTTQNEIFFYEKQKTTLIASLMVEMTMVPLKRVQLLFSFDHLIE